MRLFPEGAALEWCAALFLGGNDSRQIGARAALYYIERGRSPQDESVPLADRTGT